MPSTTRALPWLKRSTPKRLLLLCAPLALAGAPRDSNAAEMSLRMSLRLAAGYNDNVRLIATKHRGVFVTTLAPAVDLTGKTETTQASLRAQVALNRYHGDSALNDTDLLLDAVLARQLERHQLALNAACLRDSTLGSELTETGVVQENRPRARVSVAPSWSYQTSERASLKLAHNFADVRYSNAAGTRLVDYRSHNSFAVYTYRLSERNSLTASAGVLRLRRDATAAQSLGEARSTYADMLLERDVSELLRVRVGAGLNRVRFDRANSANDDNGWLAQASIERRGETSKLSASLARELHPTGSGALTRTDRLALAWNEQLAPLLSYGLGASIYRNRSLTSSERSSDRFYRLSANFSWRLSERWSIDTQLAHARQAPASGANVRANSILFNARYDLPVLTYSF